MNAPNPTPSGSVLKSAQFRRARERGWRDLEYLLRRIDRDGIASLGAAEAGRLPLLYREVLSSLSVARSIALDRNLLHYLEDLSLRAYLAVYGPRTTITERLRRFFLTGFPRTVRRYSLHLAAAALLLAVGVLAGYLLVGHDMEYYATLMPAELAGDRTPAATRDDLHRHLFAPWPGFVNSFVVFAGALFRHNTMVGFLCFGLGFVLGLPSAFLLVYNGMILGAMFALHADRGLGLDFLAWVSIHGVTELLAVALCGAAGFVVAEKILFPGALSRLDNLSRNGRAAAGMAAGAVALFFVAGILEGGFRGMINTTPGRFAFAAATAAAWTAYFARAGRRDDGGGA